MLCQGCKTNNCLSLSYQVVQKRHDFAFGSAVGATQIVDPTLKGYQDCFYDNFEWAVLENALKWKQMEPHRVSKLKSEERN